LYIKILKGIKMEFKTEVNLAGIHLESPIMNGGGTCKKLEEVKELARSATAAIMVGGITIPERELGSGTTFKSNSLFSLNAMKLANPGAKYYKKHLPEMVRIAHQSGKALFVNVAEFVPCNFARLTKLCFEKGADIVELDLSCSSCLEEQEDIICLDFGLVKEILEATTEAVGEEAKIAVKLSALYPSLIRQIAQVISHFKLVKIVTTSNTFPNALAYDDKGRQWIDSKDGLAALGGPALKPIAIGQVKQFRNILPPNIQIVHSGGVTFGIDVRDSFLAGAEAVQVSTAFLKEGPEVFERILLEYFGVIQNKNCPT
jgi:dihydroorotate dehydrogenase (fumarate)